MALPLALLAAAAAPPPMTPATLTDFMSAPCHGWNDPRVGDKLGQAAVGSYMRGAIETVADACDHGARYATCGRIAAHKVDGNALLMSTIAPRYDQLCTRNSRRTLRDIAQRILVETGWKDAPGAKGR